MIKKTIAMLVLSTLALTVLCAGAAQAQSPMPGAAGYQVEWVYRVRYGNFDEWWDLWRKNRRCSEGRADLNPVSFRNIQLIRNFK